VDSILTRSYNCITKQSLIVSYLPGVEKSPLYSKESSEQRNQEVNGDGFGTGWYVSWRDFPAIFKTTAPAWCDKNLAEISSVVDCHLLFAHVRAASPGLAISRENCHPWKIGNFMWMHNGGIAGFGQIKRDIVNLISAELYLQIEGSTDSEHAFALFIHHLEDVKVVTPDHIREAMLKTIATIFKMQREHGVTGLSSLNFAVTDGKAICATRLRNDPKDDPPTLYYSFGAQFEETTTGFKMILDPQNTKNSDTVIISSEPVNLDENEWTLIPKDSLILVYPRAGDQTKVDKIEITPIDWQNHEEPLPAHVTNRPPDPIPQNPVHQLFSHRNVSETYPDAKKSKPKPHINTSVGDSIV